MLKEHQFGGSVSRAGFVWDFWGLHTFWQGCLETQTQVDTSQHQRFMPGAVRFRGSLGQDPVMRRSTDPSSDV